MQYALPYQVGNIDEFGDMISGFKDLLESKGYSGPTVLFMTCRVGSADGEHKELIKLNNNEKVRRMLLYTGDQLDLKLAGVENDINKYTGWVSIYTLPYS